MRWFNRISISLGCSGRLRHFTDSCRLEYSNTQSICIDVYRSYTGFGPGSRLFTRVSALSEKPCHRTFPPSYAVVSRFCADSRSIVCTSPRRFFTRALSQNQTVRALKELNASRKTTHLPRGGSLCIFAELPPLTLSAQVEQSARRPPKFRRARRPPFPSITQLPEGPQQSP